MAYLDIKPDVFRERLSIDDYYIYRDGFCLMINDRKTRKGYVLRDETVQTILKQHHVSDLPGFLQMMYVDDNPTDWGLPTDEQIITWCINNAVIPHPYEEYVF